MGSGQILFPILSVVVLVATIPFAYGWGYSGHIAICRIAQACLLSSLYRSFFLSINN